MDDGRTNRSRSVFLPIALLCLSVTLAGCGGGGGGKTNSSSPAASAATSDDSTPAPSGNTPPPESTPGPSNPANAAPVISGAVGTSAPVNSLYAFTPSASDADGDALSFQIQNKPAWATFDAQTGRLSGTPTLAHAGTFPNIVISVTDGQASTTLPAFTITVAQSSAGTATLSWSAPTQNTDGSALVNLGGYVIVYGSSPSNLTQTVRVTNPSMTTYMLENLPAGTYYFAVKAFNSVNSESAQSNTISKAIS